MVALTKSMKSNLAGRANRDTKPERLVRKWLWREGFRYRRHVKTLPGTPDIVMTSLRTVILVHGCFWHGHRGCRYFHWPKSNTDFWRAKINVNRARDRRTTGELQSLGWRVIIVWECSLRDDFDGAMLRLARDLLRFRKERR